MIRVCFLLGRYPPEFSGHGIQVQRMVPMLRGHGVEATVIATRPEPGAGPIPRDDGRVLRILPQRNAFLSPLQHSLVLRRHLRAHASDYDVVHTNLLGWGTLLNLRHLKRLGLPVVYEMVLLGTDDPLTMSRRSFGRLKLSLLRPADAWVGITEVFGPTLTAVGIPAERFRCIYGGVDVGRYRPFAEDERRAARAALAVPADARVVVSAGAMLPRKGMERVLRAWLRLAPKPGRDLLLLVGPARVEEGLPAQFLGHVEELRALAAAAGATDCVRFVGRVDDLERWYGISDAFVFLSHREGQGYVIVEAMASGLPCLVSPLDGIGRELVGDAGAVADDPDDADAVASALQALLADAPRRRLLGERARRRAAERFSMASRAHAFAELYRELAGRRRRRAA